MSNKYIAVALFSLYLSHLPIGQANDEIPPVNGEEILEWLKAGKYKDWIHESEAHRSVGRHSVTVIAYLNELLNDSLARDDGEQHPKGSSAVKELFNEENQLNGWAVYVKTDSDSKNGSNWYWYEIIGTTPESYVVADGEGVGQYVGCHAPGKDFVLIPYPLR